ncbi:MCE family protein [Nocardioides nematodiphilus]|uniref:MCE family protein n=1 Tax=Nocardioides nematodiphilus TaxID=2849669 RepID=UPI001CD9A44E|nr:MlaD family protein [Nocardioides nematodiphilus]MCA1984315.1 MCE family protein [Nocardioides nematodiphilus]
MITRRTKIQLAIFVLITLVGVSFTGARYAHLDRLVHATTYQVVAHFPDSGGIYQGGEVSYRGVKVGQVDRLKLTSDGVDVYLDIDKSQSSIPADTLAVVGNRSAVGEQYVELQPQTKSAPFLKDGSQIAQRDTAIPIATDKLLGDVSRTVNSVDQQALQTTLTELGTAFAGTGEELQTILDSGTSFVTTADKNFDVTTALLKDGNTVLKTQADTEGAIRSFAQNLSLVTDTLTASNQDLIKLITNGSAGATQLREFLERNGVDLGEVISEALTTGRIVNAHLPGLRYVLVVYPYVTEGGFSVLERDADGVNWDARFGLVLTTQATCHGGYESTVERAPQDTSPRDMNTRATCTEPITKSNARGAQNYHPRAAADYRAPAVASYDEKTGRLTWGDPRTVADGTSAPTDPKDSWTWLYRQ